VISLRINLSQPKSNQNQCVQLQLKYFGDTLNNFGDTRMCRDTRFEKHCYSHLWALNPLKEIKNFKN
jgi:hypothetical protein